MAKCIYRSELSGGISDLFLPLKVGNSNTLSLTIQTDPVTGVEVTTPTGCWGAEEEEEPPLVDDDWEALRRET